MRVDRDRLADVLDAVAAIERHTGAGRKALDDELIAAAVMRWIGIIGEAAARLSPELRAAHPEIPWAGIVAMRNRLVHAYFDIDADRVWEAIDQELPVLRDQVRALLAEEPATDP